MKPARWKPWRMDVAVERRSEGEPERKREKSIRGMKRLSFSTAVPVDTVDLFIIKFFRASKAVKGF